MKEQEIKKIEDLPLEKRISQKPKELSCTLMLVLFLLPLAAAFYHYVYGGFIFHYDTLSRSTGFIVYACFSVLLPILAGLIYSCYWKSYNNIIENAKQEVCNTIKERKESPEEINRLRLLYIESIIGSDKLSQEDFLWHTRQKCWGCGKKHSETPKQFNYTKTKMESWRKDAFRYHQNYKMTASLLLCPECHSRLLKASKISQENNVIFVVVNTLLCFATSIVFAIIDASKTTSNVVDYLGVFADFIIAAGVASTLGQIIIYPLAKVISKPLEKDNKKSWTKWSFDDIPAIRHFLKEEQHEKLKN